MKEKPRNIIQYVNPRNNTPLKSCSDYLEDENTGEKFLKPMGIPRFCSPDNYSKSFGQQWMLFDKIQLDSIAGIKQSANRFYGETCWDPAELSFQSVLEVGSGAGRFSEVFLNTTQGVLHSIDYSIAVEANWKNNGHHGDRFRLSQASIYEMPFPDNSFDKIFCLGVLQHTPSFEHSIEALAKKAKVGGEIVVDFYPIKGWYTKIHAKYLLRPITKRLNGEFLLELIKKNINWMIRLHDLLSRTHLGVFTRFIPITDIRGIPPGVSMEKRRELAILDTFDGFSPQYDNPQKVAAVVNMFQRNGCDVIFSGTVNLSHGSATVVRAKKVNF